MGWRLLRKKFKTLQSAGWKFVWTIFSSLFDSRANDGTRELGNLNVIPNVSEVFAVTKLFTANNYEFSRAGEFRKSLESVALNGPPVKLPAVRRDDILQNPWQN